MVMKSWQHIVVTHDGSGNYTSAPIYNNGAEIGYNDNGNSSDGSGSLSSDFGNPHMFGTDQANEVLGKQYNDLLDDVRIYNRVLKRDEIKRLYNIGR